MDLAAVMLSGLRGNTTWPDPSKMRFRFSLAVSTLILAAACSRDQASSGSNSTDGGTLIVATLAEPANVIPPFVVDVDSRRIEDLVFEHLAEIDTTLNTIDDKSFSPRLAEKWTWAPDSLSIAFSINPAARWHDGKRVTANDVRYSFNMFADPKVESVAASLLGNVDSVSVRDSLTAVVFFKKRTPEQFYDIVYQVYVFPEHVYGSVAPEKLRTDPITKTLVGSNRFRVGRWEPGSGRIELLADTANYRGRAKLDRVIFVKTDATVAAAQIRSGQADGMEAFPVDQLATLDSNQFAHGVPWPQLSYAFMAMNRFMPTSTTVPNPIFSDLRIRRALSMAVDREAMLRNVFGPAAKNIGHGPFAMSASYADPTLVPPPYDTTKAAAMMDSSGWRRGSDGMRAKNGKPLRFSLSVGPSGFRKKYAVLLQEEFKKAGVQVDIDQLDNNAFVEKRAKHGFEAAVDNFSPDPSVAGTKQSWTTAGFLPAGENALRYSNPRVDALIDSATTTFNLAKSKAYSSRAFHLIVDDAPAIWLYDGSFTNAFSRRITVTGMRPDGWWVNMADWSIDPAKRIARDSLGLAQPKN
jgi:peptide/nickel transport system substrate-binding protein